MFRYEDMRTIRAPQALAFDVALDIERYPAFLPWVAEAKVLTRGEDVLTAELVAAVAGRRIAFRTVDRFVRPRMIQIRLLEGPFRFLESEWSFAREDEARTRVHFSIAFAFNSRLLEMIASPMFQHAARTMAAAFAERAEALAR